MTSGFATTADAQAVVHLIHGALITIAHSGDVESAVRCEAPVDTMLSQLVPHT
jgi:hypothetical protein